MTDPPAREPEINSRRNFLLGLVQKTGETAVRGAEYAAHRAARSVVRPPGALAEADFLAQCTRCGECRAACPTGVIFMLGAHTGLSFNSPALDLVHRSCRLCADFPCIAACEPLALRPVGREKVEFAEIRIDTATCLPYLGPECGVCVTICPVPGAIGLDLTLPKIDPDVCTGCAVCRQACPVEPSAISVHPLRPA